MDIKEIQILETKIKGLVTELNQLRRDNQSLKLRVEKYQKDQSNLDKTEEMIKTRIKDLIAIIDSVQVNDGQKD